MLLKARCSSFSNLREYKNKEQKQQQWGEAAAPDHSKCPSKNCFTDLDLGFLKDDGLAQCRPERTRSETNVADRQPRQDHPSHWSQHLIASHHRNSLCQVLPKSKPKWLACAYCLFKRSGLTELFWASKARWIGWRAAGMRNKDVQGSEC